MVLKWQENKQTDQFFDTHGWEIKVAWNKLVCSSHQTSSVKGKEKMLVRAVFTYEWLVILPKKATEQAGLNLL